MMVQQPMMVGAPMMAMAVNPYAAVQGEIDNDIMLNKICSGLCGCLIAGMLEGAYCSYECYCEWLCIWGAEADNLNPDGEIIGAPLWTWVAQTQPSTTDHAMMAIGWTMFYFCYAFGCLLWIMVGMMSFMMPAGAGLAATNPFGMVMVNDAVVADMRGKIKNMKIGLIAGDICGIGMIIFGLLFWIAFVKYFPESGMTHMIRGIWRTLFVFLCHGLQFKLSNTFKKFTDLMEAEKAKMGASMMGQAAAAAGQVAGAVAGAAGQVAAAAAPPAAPEAAAADPAAAPKQE